MRDAHVVVHDHDGPDRRCWATVAGGYTDCGRTAASDVGLCGTHLAELRDDTPRDPSEAMSPDHLPAGGCVVQVVIVDETHRIPARAERWFDGIVRNRHARQVRRRQGGV